MGECVDEMKNGRWAELDHDLLNEIVLKLNYCYDDYIGIRGVCREWKMALPKVPCLVLPFSEDNTLETHLAHRKIYHIRFPQLRGTKIRGSSHGWLITVGMDDTLRMINPLNPNQHFFLPPLSTLPHVVSYHPHEVDKEYLLQEFGDDIIYPVEKVHMQKSFQVQKVILSSPPDDNNPDFMVIVIFSTLCRLAFCRHDSNKWIDIPKLGKIEYRYNYKDAIFHEGKIYVIDFKGQLFESSLKKGGIPLPSIRKAPPPPLFDTQGNPHYNQAYLIGCPEGGLIMVARNFNYYAVEEHYPCCYNSVKFDIYRMSNVNTKQWSRVFKLENGAIFIGLNSSIWMTNHTLLPHGQRNNIYYTDNNLECHYLKLLGGMFNMDEGTICRFFPNSHLLCPPPVWWL
ncbi:hypothetical protein Lal_00032253 [Lupinus albus]|nr:hypothetical protein Lal_00032253 [Lupinus albus]